MNKEMIINVAKQYLLQRKIDFVEPGELGCIDGDKQEVIFLDPLNDLTPKKRTPY